MLMLKHPRQHLVDEIDGLGLYRAGAVIGALGVSGDTSCADHNVAWNTTFPV